MNDKIHAVSPLGYDVYCSQEQWDEHILKGHGEMRGNEHAVEKTIVSPDEVYKSAEYDNRDVYFKKSSGASYEAKGFGTRVIVDIPNKSIPAGDIVTAFAAKNIGGNIDANDKLYPKPDKDL